MKEIAKRIYLEDAYPGVTLGAIVLPRGSILIDAPPRPDDGRSWQASLRGLGSGTDRLLVNLDSHPDRTLGSRIMDSPVFAQDETVEIFSQRAAIFKAQNQESGAEWETCTGLTGIRWLQPQLMFSQNANITWGAFPIILEHHPGPEPGATWVVLPKQKIVFVGDAVLNKQVPFFADANLEAWGETLELLLSEEYADYTIISSRGGAVSIEAIRNLRKLLKDLHKRLSRMAKRKSSPDATDKIANQFLDKFDFFSKNRAQYAQRLSYGLYHYYARNYYADRDTK